MTQGAPDRLKDILCDTWRDFWPAAKIALADAKGPAKLWVACLVLCDVAVLSAYSLMAPFHIARQRVALWLYPRVATKLGAEDMAPYGDALAASVADTLQSMYDANPNATAPTAYMAYVHRYYCGHGLFLNDAKFEVAVVEDGYPNTILLSFDTRHAFVAWLSKQTDYALSGLKPDTPFTDLERVGNQRITRARLEAFVQSDP